MTTPIPLSCYPPPPPPPSPNCRYVVGIVFGFEHLLLVVSIFFYWAIQPVPKWVRLSIARREYLAKERLAKASEEGSKGSDQEEGSIAARAKSKEE